MPTHDGAHKHKDAGSPRAPKAGSQPAPQSPVDDKTALELCERLVQCTQNRSFREAWDLLASLSPADAKKVVNTHLPHPWYKDGPSLDTPLHVACRSIELDLARLFVRFGAGTGEKNSEDKAPLDTIAHRDFVNLVTDAALMEPAALDDMLAKREYAFEAAKKRHFGGNFSTGCTLEEGVAHAASHTTREESNPRKRIVTKLRDFGLPLFETYDGSKHKMHSRTREIPASLERILHLIERKVSTDAAAVVPKLLQVLKYYPATINSVAPYVTASPGRLALNPQRPMPQAAGNVTDEELKSAVALLRKDRKDAEKAHKHKHKYKHIDHKIEPAILMELVMQYFTTLPGPLIPSKFAATFAHLSYVNSPKAAVHQVRIFYQYLPSISRLFLARFCQFFHNVFDISNNPRNRITVSYTFAPLFFRVRDLSPTLSEDVNPRTLDQLASTISVFFTNAFVENIPYFTFTADQPVLSCFPQPYRSSKTHDFILTATATCAFPTPEFTSATSEPESLLHCAAGDEVKLLGYRKNDWLDGLANGRRGFIPRSCIKLNLFKSLPPDSSVPLAPSPLLASEALGAGLDDGTVGTVPLPPPPPAPAPAPAAATGIVQGNGSPRKVGASLLTQKPLPNDWIQALDPQTGKMYYVNITHKITQWTRPTEKGQPVYVPVPGDRIGVPCGTSLLTGECCVRTGNPELDKRLADISRVQADLLRQQVEINAEKEKLQFREQEFELRTRLEQMKPTTVKPWQITYSDLVFQDVIGEGGFGQVFRATWRGTTVAVKVLKQRGTGHRGLAGDPIPRGPNDGSAVPRLSSDMIDRFSQEVSILRSLHHPNLVLFLGASVAPRLCMVSEFMEGGSLYELLYKKKRVPDPKRRLVLALDIAKALAYLHSMQPQIVHRDLKSPNILLEEHGDHAKVGDVGLARVRGLSGEKMTGAAGTYPWMAPEMLAGRSYTEKADVYSYGIVLSEMCSGTLPFPGLSGSEVRTRVCTNGERPPLPDTLTPQWTSLVQACWSQTDTKRPSFIQVIETLQEIGSSRRSK